MKKGGMQGTKDRVDRVKRRKSGQWASVSPDFLFLAWRLYKLSEKEAEASKDGRSSKMDFAGIPLLLSSLTALIMEPDKSGLCFYGSFGRIQSCLSLARDLAFRN